MMLTTLILSLFLLFFSVDCEICQDKICRYELVIRRRQSMTYNVGRKTYNVILNKTTNQLQVIGNTFHLTGDLIGSQVSPDDVITLDGVPRNVIVINDQFPGPAIEVMENAQVEVTIKNRLAMDAVSIHWHGMHMKNNGWMDGTAYITQCPIQPQQSFTYQFIASPAGTHWYHAHLSNQRIDGLYGPLIVHKQTPDYPYFLVMLHDWNHVDGETLQLTNPYIRGTGENYASFSNRHASVDGNELSAKSYVSTLINGRGRYNILDMLPLTEFQVSQGQSCRFSIIHSGAEFAYDVKIDDHKLLIISSDGFDIKPLPVDSLIIFPGETFDVEIHANQSIGRYYIRAEIIRYGHGINPEQDNVILGGHSILVYETSDDMLTGQRRICTEEDQCLVFNCPFGGYPTHLYTNCISFNEAKSDGVDTAEMFGTMNADYEEVFLNWGFQFGSSVKARTFSAPTEPLIGHHDEYIVPCDEEACDTGCKCTHIMNLPHNKTIQMVLLSYEPLSKYLGHHSIHLHGNSFAVLKIGYPDFNQTTGKWIAPNDDIQCDTDKYCANAFWKDGVLPEFNVDNPPVKDTIVIPARGYVVIRFRTLNPGYWFFHCHTASHLIEGMAMILNVAPGQHQTLPHNFPECRNFQWDSEVDFQRYLQHGSMSFMKSHDTTWTSSVKTMIPESETTTAYDFSKLEQCLLSTEDQVTVHLDVFIGAMVGFVALGAFLATIPLLCFGCCTKARQYNMK